MHLKKSLPSLAAVPISCSVIFIFLIFAYRVFGKEKRKKKGKEKENNWNNINKLFGN